nr:uncharacterized protein LOC116429890 [Nomia melanderi]
MARNVWLFCVLFSFAVHLATETSAFVQFNGDLSKSNSSDEDPLKGSNERCGSAVGKPADDDCEGKSSSEKPKLVRVPLRPRRTRSIDSSVNTMNQNEGNARESKPARNTMTSTVNPTEASNVPETQPKSTKKGHKKLKLAQSKPGHKKSKGKGRSSDKDREEADSTKKTKRHIGGLYGKQQTADNQIDADRGKESNNLTSMFHVRRGDDYYAKRKAVMDMFRKQRQRMQNEHDKATSTIAVGVSENYRRSSTLKSVVPSPTTERARPNSTKKPIIRMITKRKTLNDDPFADPGEEYEYYDESEEQISTTQLPYSIHSTSNRVITTQLPYTIVNARDHITPAPTTMVKKDRVYEWGSCADNSRRMFFQNNLSVDVNKWTEAETDVMASIGEDYCVECVRIELTTDSKSEVSVVFMQGGHAKLKITGRANERLSFVARYFATRKKNGRC